MHTPDIPSHQDETPSAGIRVRVKARRKCSLAGEIYRSCRTENVRGEGGNVLHSLLMCAAIRQELGKLVLPTVAVQ